MGAALLFPVELAIVRVQHNHQDAEYLLMK